MALPTAISAYEFERSLTIKTTGCVTNDKYKDVLISPDGLVGEDGGVEIKSRNDEIFYGLIQGERKSVPKNQIQMCLLITERKWWDYVAFNPNFDKPLYIERIYPDLAYFEKLKTGFESGRKLISEYIKRYNDFSL